MTIEKVFCDECGRVKAEANHWHQIGVFRGVDDEEISLMLGNQVIEPGSDWILETHDICGEQCFHKHIAKLLGFNEPPLFTKASGVDPENDAVSAGKSSAEAKS